MGSPSNDDKEFRMNVIDNDTKIVYDIEKNI